MPKFNNSLPVIADVEITTDEHGRFNLNALHKASGGKPRDRNEPSKWLRLDGTAALIEVLKSTDLETLSIETTMGRNGGTFAHELPAIEYAGWISPAFRLKVNQTFIDYRTGTLQPDPLPLSRMDLIQIAYEAEQEAIALRAENSAQTEQIRDPSHTTPLP